MLEDVVLVHVLFGGGPLELPQCTVDETVVDEGDDDLLITGLKEAFGEVLSVLCGLFGSSLILEAGEVLIAWKVPLSEVC